MLTTLCQIILKVTPAHPPMPSPAAPENRSPPPRCPACGSEFIKRMARQGLRDYFHFLFGRFPFRCRRCGRVFYLPHRGDQYL